jgi:hypothetical protein
VTTLLSLLRYSAVGIKRVIPMAKNVPSKGTAKGAAAKNTVTKDTVAKEAAAKDVASRSTSARKSLSRARPEKKRVRRVIFKSDQWYANAAMSIGIAGRPKGVRSGAATALTHAKDQAE